MLCVGRLNEFMNTVLDGTYAAEVKDGVPILGKKLNDITNCGEIKCYFNTGAILFNVKLYCEQEMFTKFIELLEKFNTKLVFFDQDTYNILFNEKVVFVDEKFNLQKIDTNIEDVRIVHFAGIRKPWYREFENYYYEEWRRVYQRTPWGNQGLKCKNKIEPSEYRYQAEYFFCKGDYARGVKSYLTYIIRKILT